MSQLYMCRLRFMASLKVTPQTARVLATVLDDPLSDFYGFEVAKVTGLQSGTLYPILARLETIGILASAWESDNVDPQRPRRRYYRLTPDGLDAARALLNTYIQRTAPERGSDLSPVFGGAV